MKRFTVGGTAKAARLYSALPLRLPASVANRLFRVDFDSKNIEKATLLMV